MSKNIEIDDMYDDDDFLETDFEFIISQEGNLKSVSLPKNTMYDLPEEIELILKIFGISDLHSIIPRTLH